MSKSKYDTRRENFIRQYAKTHDVSISESRRFYEKDYQKISDDNRRKIAKDLRNAIKDKYPEKHPAEQKREKKFKRPKLKAAHGKRYEELKQQTQGHITQKRVLRASLKYPTASKFELQHGVNSKVSEKYRSKHNK